MKINVIVVVAALFAIGGCKKTPTPAETPKSEPSKPAKAKTATQPTDEKVAPKEPKAEAKPASPAEPDVISRPGPIEVKDVGLATPESILHDSVADLYLVSNINGDPLEADGNGFISQITPEGKVKTLKWIDGAADGTGLHAPKGMAISGDTLYVTDINHVRAFERDTGGPKNPIKIEKASFLNDICSGPNGSIFVSDSGLTTGFESSGTDAIYQIKGAEVKAIAKTINLGRPNGLLYHKNSLWVVTFGTGEIYSISGDGIRANISKPEKGQLDGLEATADGKIIYSSWEGQAVYMGPAKGPFEAVITGVKAPADIGWDAKRNRVLIPLFNDNALQFHSL